MAYVYRHIRVDKNEPFYIGISNEDNYFYKRAYNASLGVRGRNNIWHNIVKKTRYNVDIMMDDITWSEAVKVEKYFIKLYGRKNNKTGILSNLTDGGEGVIGLSMSTSAKEKLSLINSKPIAQYDLNGIFITHYKGCVEASRILNVSNTPIWACVNLKKSNYTAYGFIWRLYNGDNSNITVDKNTLFFNSVKKPIKCFNRHGIFLNKYESITQAAFKLNLKTSNISQVLSGVCKTTNGYIFKLDDGNDEDIDTTNLYPIKTNIKAHGKIGVNLGKKGVDHPASKSVIQLDKFTNETIEIFTSIREAAKKTQTDVSAITACCKNKPKYNTAGGFKWEYYKKQVNAPTGR